MKMNMEVNVEPNVLMNQSALISEYVKEHYNKKDCENYNEHIPTYTIANNMQQIIAMDNFLKCTNDERIYVDHWLYIYPDECDFNEVMEMAADPEQMCDLLREFIGLLKLAWDANDLFNISYMHGKIEDERKMNEEEDWL